MTDGDNFGAGIDLSTRPNGTFGNSFKQGLFAFYPNRHDSGPKTFLGQDFPADRGFSEIESAIDILCRHPSTARFISRKLAENSEWQMEMLDEAKQPVFRIRIIAESLD